MALLAARLRSGGCARERAGPAVAPRAAAGASSAGAGRAATLCQGNREGLGGVGGGGAAATLCQRGPGAGPGPGATQALTLLRQAPAAQGLAGLSGGPGRRQALLLLLAPWLGAAPIANAAAAGKAAAASEYAVPPAPGSGLTPPEAVIRGAAPDPATFPSTDADLRAAADLFQQALNAPSVEEEERLWTAALARCGPVEIDGAGGSGSGPASP